MRSPALPPVSKPTSFAILSSIVVRLSAAWTSFLASRATTHPPTRIRSAPSTVGNRSDNVCNNSVTQDDFIH